MKNTLLVAEIGLNANGDINIAKDLIKTAAFFGCDYVKFQKRSIDLVYTKKELDSPRESVWGTTFRDQKEGLEFGVEEYKEIDACCKFHKIGWFASPWDKESIEFLCQFGIPFLKIPSALITDFEFLQECKKSGIPLILSTGMSTSLMVKKAVSFLGRSLFYILACTSTYPTKTEEINLNYILTLKKEYKEYKIGFSNHSPGIIYMPVAVGLGAEMVEFHITLDRTMEGSDQAASIESSGIFKNIKYIRAIEKALGDGVKKIYDSEKPIMKKLRR